MASVDRIATWGWLMMAAVSTEPAEPLLEMVNVPPWISSGEQARAWARVGEVDDLPGDGPQALGVGVADDRHQEALVVEVDGDAEVDEAGARPARRRPRVAFRWGNSARASMMARLMNGR